MRRIALGMSFWMASLPLAIGQTGATTGTDGVSTTSHRGHGKAKKRRNYPIDTGATKPAASKTTPSNRQ